MINIFIYGLDQFVVGDISVELTEILARTYEVEEDEINFIAPNSMVFHKGVEQTSWRVVIEVEAPDQFAFMQMEVKEILQHYISQVAVHLEILFRYYQKRDHYEHINPEYPLYMTENITNNHLAEGESYDDDEELSEGDGDDEIYTGDMFDGLMK